MEILSLSSLDCILFEPLNFAFGQMSSKSGLNDDRFHFLSPLHHPAENLSGSNSLHQMPLKPIDLVSSMYLQSLLFFHLPDKVIGLALLGLKWSGSNFGLQLPRVHFFEHVLWYPHKFLLTLWYSDLDSGLIDLCIEQSEGLIDLLGLLKVHFHVHLYPLIESSGVQSGWGFDFLCELPCFALLL